MERGDAAREIVEADPLEAGLGEHAREFGLWRKTADAFGEILVSGPVAGDLLSGSAGRAVDST